jgi:hypothetical protein
MIYIVSQELWSSTINKCGMCAVGQKQLFPSYYTTCKGRDYLPRLPNQETIKVPDGLKRASLRQK